MATLCKVNCIRCALVLSVLVYKGFESITMNATPAGLNLCFPSNLSVSAPPRFASLKFLRCLDVSKKYFDVVGIFSQLRSCNVSVAVSGSFFDAGFLIF